MTQVQVRKGSTYATSICDSQDRKRNVQHGLQEMDGRSLTLPHRRADRPSKDRFAERYSEFKDGA